MDSIVMVNFIHQGRGFVEECWESQLVIILILIYNLKVLYNILDNILYPLSIWKKQNFELDTTINHQT